MTEAMLAILILIAILVVFAIFRIVNDAPDRAELARLQTRDIDFENANKSLNDKTRECEYLRVENARLEASLEHVRIRANEKVQILQDSEERLKREFENLANRIFEVKGKSMTEENHCRITSIIQPFKDQLESFRKRVDDVHQQDVAQSARLIEQVRSLHELSNRVSSEANNLAEAIKGGAKKQGDWGELIVERLLEASGLQRGIDFDTQVTFRSEDGTIMRPDFIINLPENKAVICDSKVSLTAFEKFCSLEHDEAKKSALTDHVSSVRRHLESLRSKDYSSILGNRTLDFVIMCVPLEPAYQAALQADDKLLYDLAGSTVVITGPATFMITLKMIAQIWRRENENRNAQIIADKAGRLYDQVKSVADAILDAQKKLTGVSDSFSLAVSRLTEGRGNLIGRVEELKRLGAKVNKQIAPELVERALVEHDKMQ